MKKLYLLSVLCSASFLHAETITGKIHSVEANLLKFENGRVAFFKDQKLNINPGSLVKAQLDDSSELTGIEVLTSSQKSLNLEPVSFVTEEQTPPTFEPTIVPSMDEAHAIFNRSNPYYKRISECTDRAHVWAHDEFKKSGTKSMKAFVFFTASYINSVRFKWWFHVAPMYKVADNGEVKDIVMDYRYTDRPMTVKEWTDQLVYTKRPCKVTTKFSEYDVNPQTENCYLIFESMHYRLPGDISDQETRGRYKTTTTEFELKSSFRFAFEK